MNQQKAKAIRKEVRSVLLERDITEPYVKYEYRASNPDIAGYIKQHGLESLVKIKGYAQVSCFLTPDCLKYRYKEAKRT
jgi:hypothetical protein